MELCSQPIMLDIFVSAGEIHAKTCKKLSVSRGDSETNHKKFFLNSPIWVLPTVSVALVCPTKYLQWFRKDHHRMNVLGMVGVDVDGGDGVS